MKKWIMAFVCLMTMVVFSSCGTNYVVTANYDVCYPDGVRNYNETAVVFSIDKPYVSCYSFNGTNYVSVVKGSIDTKYGATNVVPKTTKTSEHFSSSTAPMRLNSYYVEKAKKKRSTAYNKSKKDDLYMSDILSY